MNSPPKFFKAEQLTPSSSPISLSLDDSRNLGHTPNFANLLASPTRFKLSDAMAISALSSTSSSSSNSNNNNGYALTTSLSKLKTYKKNIHPMEQKNNDFSSVLFKEQNFQNIGSNGNISFNNKNNRSAKPMMFKQEFVSNYSSLPLLSTLLKVSNSLKTNGNKQKKETLNTNATSKPDSNNINSLLDDNLPKLSIKETLERIQKHHQNLNVSNNNDNDETNNDRSDFNINIPTTATKRHSENRNAINNNTASATAFIPSYDSQNNAIKNINLNNTYDIIESKVQPTECLLAPPLELHVMQKPVSNTVTSTSTFPQKQELINEQTVPNLPTFNSDHVLLDNGVNIRNPAIKYFNQPNNRYSLVSSTSTDYDNFDFIEQMPSMVTAHPLPDINEYTSRLESSKLDLKIKQLEVEINELKLQNIKLINSISTSNGNQHQNNNLVDQMSSKNTHGYDIDLQDQWIDGSDETTRLKNKVKELEKKISSYKRTISKYQQNSKLRAPSKRRQLHIGNSHHRISRLSPIELQKYGETTDPSSSFSSICSDDEIEDTIEENVIFTSDSILNHQRTSKYNKNNRDGEYEADIEEHPIQLPKRKGFNLHIPIEK
ncbi:hypothetical protein RI543_003338 [Arxiozyma heterogenica]|uniref:Uncharacterized protein n=1 Tax=Arxiozyma heterogenica TaxID=278026 RepID=A0AAN8A6U9_9SACH|nr:hypothetical protein RI543_003338 [Kazachstania heterogenica]